MGALLHTPLLAPPHRQPVSGLVALATPFPDPPDGWEGGFAFDPESCTDPLIHAIDCDAGTLKARSTNAAFVEYAPANIIQNSWCSTLTGNATAQRVIDRAGRALTASQSWALEQLLWTGVAVDDDPADGTVRPHLADGRATVLASGPGTNISEALARMDQALTECLWGQQGMVHMPPGALARAWQSQAVHREGGRWLTPNGHVVVAGSGYTGGAPRAGVGQALPAPPDLLADPIPTYTIYGTGQVYTLLGSAFTVDEVIREINDHNARAERAGAAFYGPCCQFAVAVAAET